MTVPTLRRYMDIMEDQLRFPPPKDDTYESAVEIAREMFNAAKRNNSRDKWDNIRYEIAMNYSISEEDLRIDEAKKPKTTYAEPELDVKRDTDIHFDEPSSKGEVGAYNEPEKEKRSTKKDLPGKKRSKADSRRQASQADLPQGAGDVMRDFMNRTQGVTDTVAVPADYDDLDNWDVDVPVEPKPPGQEVATIGQEVATISTALANIDDDIELNWHQLKHLPGYALEQIRGAFRPLFREFMNVELEDVTVVTTLDGSIEKDDLRSFMGFLSANGEKFDEFDLEAFGIDRDTYHVEKAYMYHYNGFNFLLMQEKLQNMRNWYIYAGPATRGTELTGPEDVPQIEGS